VLGFSFDIETGELATMVIGALGIPLLGEGVLSTWELTVEEIVSSGPDRIIVYEGAEDKLKQLGSGLLEKLVLVGRAGSRRSGIAIAPAWCPWKTNWRRASQRYKNSAVSSRPPAKLRAR
jgi:hypothetical protein